MVKKWLNWILYFDKSSNISTEGDDIILEGQERVIVEHSLCFDFQMTNNQVEYEALIIGLKLMKDMGVKSLVVRSES